MFFLGQPVDTPLAVAMGGVPHIAVFGVSGFKRPLYEPGIVRAAIFGLKSDIPPGDDRRLRGFAGRRFRQI